MTHPDQTSVASSNTVPQAVRRYALKLDKEVSDIVKHSLHQAATAQPLDALGYLTGVLPRLYQISRQARDLYAERYGQAFDQYTAKLAGEFGSRALARQLAMKDVSGLLEIHLRIDGAVNDLQDLFKTLRVMAGKKAAGPSGFKRTFS